jgi:HTH-type transcriptional regulator / antitoxin HigA
MRGTISLLRSDAQSSYLSVPLRSDELSHENVLPTRRSIFFTGSCTEDDYDAALLEVERLWGAKLCTPEGDRLDVLATLIDSYEQTHHPMDPPDPIEAIKFRMSQQNLTRKQLEPMIGTRTRVAEVLNRRRSLSISMIRRLHSALGISAEVLIRPSRTTTAGKRQIGR